MITKQISEREYNIVSFQTSDVLNTIYTEPIYKPDINKIYYKGYSKYYLEIANLMRTKGINMCDGDIPVWGHYCFNGDLAINAKSNHPYFSNVGMSYMEMNNLLRRGIHQDIIKFNLKIPESKLLLINSCSWNNYLWVCEEDPYNYIKKKSLYEQLSISDRRCEGIQAVFPYISEDMISSWEELTQEETIEYYVKENINMDIVNKFYESFKGEQYDKIK